MNAAADAARAPGPDRRADRAHEAADLGSVNRDRRGRLRRVPPPRGRGAVDDARRHSPDGDGCERDQRVPGARGSMRGWRAPAVAPRAPGHHQPAGRAGDCGRPRRVRLPHAAAGARPGSRAPRCGSPWRGTTPFYTPLKRVSAFAVVPGALIGALPPAIGWTAAGGHRGGPDRSGDRVRVLHLAGAALLDAGGDARGRVRGGRLPTIVKRLGRQRLARLSFTWICGTAAACALLPMFRAITLPALLLLAAAVFWLVYSGTPLLRPDPPRRSSAASLSASTPSLCC